MFSVLRPSLVYTDISGDITEQDEDHDASEWSYSDKTVYRGALDTTYRNHGLDVYSLYDDNLLRIGLAEHECENHSVFQTLWFRDNAFSTLLQEDWKADGTLWDRVTSEAYHDCLDTEFREVNEKGCDRLVLPNYIMNGVPFLNVCPCGTSFSPRACASVKKKIDFVSPIFIDDSFVVYNPPPGSQVWSRLGLQHDACAPLLQAAPQQEPQPEPLQEPQMEALQQS